MPPEMSWIALESRDKGGLIISEVVNSSGVKVQASKAMNSKVNGTNIGVLLI